MLMVKHKISQSTIHGVGVFADQDIKKGDLIWKFDRSTCEIYTMENFIYKCSQLKLSKIFELLHYSYIKNNKVFYILNEAKFINHSFEPNVGFKNWKREVALRDIKKGEEILENYYLNYDPNDFFSNPLLFEYLDRESLLNRIGTLSANYSYVC